MDNLHLVTHPVHAYDLGAGVGRHTLPIVAGLPTGSRVTAVDLIPSALANLVDNAAAAGLANREEVTASGARRAALVELPLSGEQARSVLRRCFVGGEIHVDETIPAAVTEERNGALHELRSTLIKFVAQAPD